MIGLIPTAASTNSARITCQPPAEAPATSACTRSVGIISSASTDSSPAEAKIAISGAASGKRRMVSAVTRATAALGPDGSHMPSRAAQPRL